MAKKVSSNHSLFLTVVGLVILFLGIIVLSLASQQKQTDTNSRAATPTAPSTTFYFKPSETTIDPNRKTINIMMDTGSNSVTKAKIALTYMPQLVSNVTLENGPAFPEVISNVINPANGTATIELGMPLSIPEQTQPSLKGTYTIAKISFVANVPGTIPTPQYIKFSTDSYVWYLENAGNGLVGTVPLSLVYASPTPKPATPSPTGPTPVAACNQVLTNLSFSTPCSGPPNGGFKTFSYTCANGSSQTITSQTCQALATMTIAAQSQCILAMQCFPSPQPTMIPSPYPSVYPSSSPIPATRTPTPAGTYPRPKQTSNSKINLVEYAPKNGSIVYLGATVDPSVTVDHIDWYINGNWSATDATRPYILGSESNGTPRGFTLPTPSATVRIVVYYNSQNFIEGSVQY